MFALLELLQKIFYRPNKIQNEISVEDINAQKKSVITQAYIQNCTQQYYAKKYGGGSQDPRRTYDNLQVCTSGTFKSIADNEPSLQEITVLENETYGEIKVHDLRNIVTFPQMSDSQIRRTEQRRLIVSPFVREHATDFNGGESGTYQNLQSYNNWLNNVRSKSQGKDFTQSGVYALPDVNPHGLKHFIAMRDEEKSA